MWVVVVVDDDDEDDAGVIDVNVKDVCWVDGCNGRRVRFLIETLFGWTKEKEKEGKFQVNAMTCNSRVFIVDESCVFSSVCISRMIGVVIIDWWLLLWSIERWVVDMRTDDGVEYTCVGKVNWTGCCCCWEELIDSDEDVDGRKCIWMHGWCEDESNVLVTNGFSLIVGDVRPKCILIG